MILERLYSKKDKKKDVVIGTEKGRDSVIKSLLIGNGISLGSLGAWKLSSSSLKKMDKEKISKDDEVLYNKLVKTSKNKGHNLYRIPKNPIGSYVLPPGQVKDNVRKEIEALDKTFNPKKSTILVDTYHPASVAHEMGHAHFYDDKNANKLIKAVHNPYLYYASNKLSGIPAAIVGFKSGKNSVKHEKEGTKESKLSRLSGMGTGLAASLPHLVAEGSASYKGLQYLKQHGADPRQMKRARKNLALAGGTYLATTGANVAAGELGRAMGKAYAFRKEEKKNKEK